MSKQRLPLTNRSVYLNEKGEFVTVAQLVYKHPVETKRMIFYFPIVSNIYEMRRAGVPWDEVGNRVGYSPRHCMRLWKKYGRLFE